MLDPICLLLIALTVFLFWKYTSLDDRFIRLGNKIPGPKGLPIIGSLLSIPTGGPEGLNYRRYMVQKYGHISRIWLGNILFVFLSDPKDCEIVLKDTRNLSKSVLYSFFHPWLGTGLLTSTGEKWHIRRKAITPTLHFKILEKFTDIFEKNSNTLVNCLKQKCNGDVFNVQPYISRYTLDVICETAMGTEINAQINQNSVYVSAVRRMCNLISDRMRKPWLHSSFVYSILGKKKEEIELLDILHGYTDKVIKEKSHNIMKEMKEKDLTNEEEIRKKTAFLELLLKMKISENPAFKSNLDVREEVDTFMFEGHDTTSAAICFALVLISRHREVQEKIYQELIDLELSHGNLSCYESLQKMKYLECVIKESLRLYPSVPVIGRELYEDVHLSSGYVVPAGAVLLISMYFLHRNEKYFARPYEFNPDNFLHENIVNRHPYAYLPFSAGPRNCIGQKFAMLELKSVLSKIILNFILEPAENEWSLVEDPNIVFQSRSGHRMRLLSRKM